MRLFIFGSTGDLVKRKILPALHEFEDLNVYVLGRKKLNNEQYNEEYCKTCSEKFKLKLNYLQISFGESIYPQLDGLLEKEEINYFYISVPPSFTADILKKIIELKKRDFKIRILIEKPFGSGIKEAEILAKTINKNRIMKEVYLADHYLFKKSILHLNKTPFTKLRLVSLERIGLEGRAYYDSVGALKDMIQSHFFNILHKLAKFSAEDIKITEFKRGQYKEYQKELGKESTTETYAKIKFNLNNKEIEFETGKKYPQKESFIEIDGLRKEVNSEKGDYVNLFDSFFKQKHESFPTIDTAIINWEIIEKIEKDKPEIFFY